MKRQDYNHAVVAETLHKETAVPQEQDRRYWPEDKPMPDSYRRRALYPCPECSRVLLDTLGVAVEVRSIQNGVAYMRCKSCGHRFKMMEG